MGERSNGRGKWRKANINHVVQSTMYCSLEGSRKRESVVIWFGLICYGGRVFLEYDYCVLLYCIHKTESLDEDLD
jgi:hypothetical protein